MSVTTHAAAGASSGIAPETTLPRMAGAVRRARESCAALLMRYIRRRIAVECEGPGRPLTRRRPA